MKFKELQQKGVLKNTETVIADYTANSWDRVVVDTTGGVVTITLPAIPSDQEIVSILDVVGSASTNNIIVTVGDPAHNIMGDVSFTIDVANAYTELQFITSTNSWRLLAIPLPEIEEPKVIEESVTWFVNTTTGDDVNGDGSAVSPFLTVQGAIDELSKYKITNSGYVTIEMQNTGVFVGQENIRFSHPNGERVAVNLLNEDTDITVNGASYDGGSGLITFTTSTAHGYTTGDYVAVSNITPTNYNNFGSITVTGGSSFTMSIGTGKTLPAFSGAGVSTRQNNVFTTDNANCFKVLGVLDELYIATAQTGTLSGSSKFGVLVGDLKELVSFGNRHYGNSTLAKGKAFVRGYTNGTGFYAVNGSVVSNYSVIANNNGTGFFGFNSVVFNNVNLSSNNNSLSGCFIANNSSFVGGNIGSNNNGANGCRAENGSVYNGITINSSNNASASGSFAFTNSSFVNCNITSNQCSTGCHAENNSSIHSGTIITNNCGQHGVLLRDSSVGIVLTITSNNGNEGCRAENSSTFRECNITSNDNSFGCYALNGSSYRLGNITATGNSSSGVLCVDCSSFDSVIINCSNSGSDNCRVENNSTMRACNITADNAGTGGSGCYAANTSSYSGCTIQAISNTAYGCWARAGSSFYANTITSNSNGSDGCRAQGNSHFGSNIITSNNNDSTGCRAITNCSFLFNNITANANGSVGWSAQENSSFSNNLIVSVFSGNPINVEVETGSMTRGNGITGATGLLSPGYQANANFNNGTSRFVGAMIFS